ncbi:MAG TPA: DUF2066 domain-containing protein [Alphaproteobacteria bacterium]
MVPSLVANGFRRLFFASFFLSLPLLAGFADGWAQTPGDADVYTVENVPLDTTAQTAAAARETALANGQAEALRRLLARLTVRADAARLPRLSAAETGDLVRGIELEGEKASSVRYIASLRVRFRADGVRSLLRRSGIPFAETRSKPMLVLPVLSTESGPILWEETTPWREAWANIPRSEGLVPLIVPVGDLDDVRAIDAAKATSGDTTQLAAIAARYNAGDVIVAVATPQSAGGTVSAVQVSLSRFSASGQDETLVENYGAEPGKDVWAKAAAGVAVNIEEAWKRSALIRYDNPRSLTATVSLAGIDELVEVRRRLANVAILQRAELVYLARNEAQFRFDYFGDERQLASALAQNDLVLEQSSSGGWRVRPRGMATSAKPAPSAPPAASPAVDSTSGVLGTMPDDLPPPSEPDDMPDETVIVR